MGDLRSSEVFEIRVLSFEIKFTLGAPRVTNHTQTEGHTVCVHLEQECNA